MNFFLALIPILVILVLMVKFRWSAARAGAGGYLSALVIALAFFGANPKLLAYAHTKAFLLTIDVLFIIWSAFLLYRVADEAGAIAAIGKALPHLTADKGMQALVIGWAFASFLQGVGGFGVPVAVIAPILVGLGFPPLSAVVIPAVGHSWGVTFGSLGSSFQALLSATGLSQEALGPMSALFLGISALAIGVMVSHAAGGWVTVRRLLLPGFLIGLVMASVQFAAVLAGFWNVSAFLGGAAGLLIAFPLARRYRGDQPNDRTKLDTRGLLIALSAYVILIVITFALELIPGLKDSLSQTAISMQFPEIQTSLGYLTPAGAGRKIPIFSHAGAVLTYAAVLAYLIYRWEGLFKPGSTLRIVNGLFKGVLSSSVSIAAMVAMSVTMQHAGMTDTLAQGLAQGIGWAFPFMSPWIGALGAFMTGSNTNSNVVFAALQLRTSELLGYSAAVILAAQTAGGALGSVIAPTKVVVGASTAGMQGREGEIMQKMLVYIGLLLLLISILAVLGVLLVGGN